MRRRFAPELTADVSRLPADGDLEQLVDEMQATGDPALIRSLIERCASRAMGAAAKYADHFGVYFTDDLGSIALLGLTKGAIALAKKKKQSKNANAWGYLSQYVWGALRRTHDDGMSAVHQTRKEHRRLGMDDIPTCYPVSSDTPEPTSRKPSFAIDIWDELEACCETDIQKRILHLKADGLSTNEIASELGITANAVRLHLRRIEQRYESRK